MGQQRGRIYEDGAIINVEVMLGMAELDSIDFRHEPSEASFTTLALIDTGASRTVVAPMVLERLGAMPRGFAMAEVSGNQQVPAQLYDVRIFLGGDSLL